MANMLILEPMMRSVFTLYLYRLLAGAVLFTPSVVNLQQPADLTTAFIWLPLLTIVAASLFVIGDQKLQQLINSPGKNKVTNPNPAVIHKVKFKPVRTHKHVGCRLLGLKCAA